MKFCAEHWARLRAAIHNHGLEALIPSNGEHAAKNVASQAKHGTKVDNFDPLMAAHNLIGNATIEKIGDQYQQNALMLMADPKEHPDWVCPVCALNWCHAEHLKSCTDIDCSYPDPWDWTDTLVDGAADFILEEWRKVVKIR